jgi:hypothetical protein
LRHRLCHSLRRKTRREPLPAAQKARRFNDFRWMKSAGMEIAGGGGGIRTHDTLARMPVFKTGLFNHSSTPPQRNSYSSQQNIQPATEPCLHFSLHLSRKPLQTDIKSPRRPQCGSAFPAGQSGENEIDKNCVIRNRHMLVCPYIVVRPSALHIPSRLWLL